MLVLAENLTIPSPGSAPIHSPLLTVFSMSGKNSPRCRKLIHRLELELGKEEVEMVRQEIDDAIYDLSPLTRSWI